MVKARYQPPRQTLPAADVTLPDGTTVTLRSEVVHAAHVYGTILATLSDDERRAFDVLVRLTEMAKHDGDHRRLVLEGDG